MTRQADPTRIQSRRRIVLWCVSICFLLLCISHVVAWFRFGMSDFTQKEAIFVLLESALILPLPSFILLLPTHSDFGSRLQLAGLVFPLLVAATSCYFCARPVALLADLEYTVFTGMVALGAAGAYALLWIIALAVRFIIKKKQNTP